MKEITQSMTLCDMRHMQHGKVYDISQHYISVGNGSGFCTNYDLTENKRVTVISVLRALKVKP